MRTSASTPPGVVGRLRGASVGVAGAASQLSASGWAVEGFEDARSPVSFVVNSSGIEKTPHLHAAIALGAVPVRPAQRWRETRSSWATSSAGDDGARDAVIG